MTVLNASQQLLSSLSRSGRPVDELFALFLSSLASGCVARSGGSQSAEYIVQTPSYENEKPFCLDIPERNKTVEDVSIRVSIDTQENQGSYGVG